MNGSKDAKRGNLMAEEHILEQEVLALKKKVIEQIKAAFTKVSGKGKLFSKVLAGPLSSQP